MLKDERSTARLTAVRGYLHDTLGIDPAISLWPDVGRLPYYLQDAFELYELKIRDLSVLLAVNRRAKTPRLDTVRGQMEQLKSLADRPAVYVTDALASFERKRLIGHKVPFIVPGNQLYLPDLGIDLREYFRQKTQVPEHALSPATQAMLISALSRKSTQPTWHPAETAAELGYTPMTLSRAVRELTAAGIATLERKGKARWLHMNRPPAETWDLAKPLLRSPVNRRVWTLRSPILLQPEQRLPLAGLSALAHYSRLAEPALSIYAMDFKQWRILAQRDLPMIPEPTAGSFQLEVWNYAPSLGGGIVDPLSLSLSLQNETDERVQSALEELQEHFPW